jgi:pimeloyl-ACP methyl ester carboxylesterase
VLNHIKKSEEFESDIDLKNISLIGHSRGAGSVLIKASEELMISKIISWAGVSDFKVRFNEGSKEFDNWKKNGIMYVKNARTKQSMPHYFQFYQDFKKNEERFNIKSAVEKLKIPFLIIHGSKDTSVLPEEGENLFSWSKSGEIQIIEGSDHVFKSKHPWQSKKLPEDLKKVVCLTINFLEKN